MDWRETLCARLSPQAAALLRRLSDADARSLTEMRFYLRRPAELVFGRRATRTDCALDEAGMAELLAALSGRALYACERQMAEGYIPLPGGHRAGVCGRLVREDGRARLSAVTSVCVRVARRVPGASRAIRPFLLDKHGRPMRVLLLGAPGSGKTTALRDAAIYLSDERGLHVAVADEREELFPEGALRDEGKRVDVLAGEEKARALCRLLRAMAPDVLVTDELGGAQDAGALLDAARCGVGLLASAHADGLADARSRPALRAALGAFDRCLYIGPMATLCGAWDARGTPLTEEGEGIVWPDGTSR